MSPWRDVVDWVGGYPFEVAKPEEIFAFYRKKGFLLVKLETRAGSVGCNQYVFISASADINQAQCILAGDWERVSKC